MKQGVERHDEQEGTHPRTLLFICACRRADAQKTGEAPALRSPARSHCQLARPHDWCRTEWEQQIDEHLNRAQIILLLISANFLASPYCSGIEMKRAMERHEANEARVIPVILRSVHWKDVPFAKLQMLPTDGKPIASSRWHNQDEAFTNVAEGIRKVIDELNAAPGNNGTLVNTPLPSRTQTSHSTPIIWNVPYRQNPFFTGRGDVLQQLHEYFTQAKTAALTQPPAITGLVLQHHLKRDKRSKTAWEADCQFTSANR